MKKENRVLCAAGLAAAAAGLAAAVLVAGCEVESADQAQIGVTPSYAEVSMGGSIMLTASGWRDYSWSLSKTDIGYLSSQRGERVIYYPTKAPAYETKTTQAAQVDPNTGMTVTGTVSQVVETEILEQVITVSTAMGATSTNSAGIAVGTARVRHHL
jgi:hypothetical protein